MRFKIVCWTNSPTKCWVVQVQLKIYSIFFVLASPKLPHLDACTSMPHNNIEKENHLWGGFWLMTVVAHPLASKFCPMASVPDLQLYVMERQTNFKLHWILIASFWVILDENLRHLHGHRSRYQICTIHNLVNPSSPMSDISTFNFHYSESFQFLNDACIAKGGRSAWRRSPLWRD